MTKEELKLTSKEAFKELKENAEEFCEWELVRLNIIEKDLEILYMLKKNMRIETDYDEDTCKEYEYITYNGMFLEINSEEEYNKIKDWILK